MVGAIDERGRLPGSMRLATRLPFWSRGVNEKSVSWLLSKKPSTSTREPNADSILVVMLNALPKRSTMLRWLVDSSSGEAAG